MKRITILLPDELHERLRREAFLSRMSVAELIRSRLRQCASENEKRRRGADPLLKAAGVCPGPQFSQEVDEELYGI